VGRVYIGLDPQGKEQYHWVGRYTTRRERDQAVAQARVDQPWETTTSELPTVAAYVADTIERMEFGSLLTKQDTRFKKSSIVAAKGRLGQLARSKLGELPLDEVTRYAATRWAETVPAGVVNDVVVLFNRAVDEELLDRNPFRGLGRRVVGRADTDPPTDEQMILLLAGCSALGDAYAFRMRAMITFAAYTIMRPGELFALDWERDIDLHGGVVHVRERVYEGTLDLPKSNPRRAPRAARARRPGVPVEDREATVATDHELVLVAGASTVGAGLRLLSRDEAFRRPLFEGHARPREP
jgi:integrase